MMHHWSNTISWSKLSLLVPFVAIQLSLANIAMGETCSKPVGASSEGVIICDLGVLEGGSTSFANAVSEDGKTVVGVSSSSVVTCSPLSPLI